MLGLKIIRSAVNIEESKHARYDALSKGKDAPFAFMWQVFLTAACIGKLRGKKIPLKTAKKIFSWSDQFAADDLQSIIAAIVIDDARDPLAIIDQDKMLTTLEQFANGGIEELHDEVTSKGMPTLNLANLALTEK